MNTEYLIHAIKIFLICNIETGTVQEKRENSDVSTTTFI
ncbi:Uncharacterized protein dnm_057360 [Desulfonema magnum]|uniref:Uncharacterized protein n=1 Tax=Desulfonema magnum TaxID=45655 RepID=A0A975BR46_9BACT|nr:Uncharacterized protein dnm_057360 [Desulfonema magnum]